MHIADWDMLRVFLTVARTGRLVLAARQLDVDHATVSRRLSELEKSLGARLFDRSPRGVELTESGRALVVHAERVELTMSEAADSIGQAGKSLVGTVRMSTPEAFGVAFLAQHVPELRRRYPELTLELIPETRALSLSRREADLAVTFSRPSQGRLISQRLMRYGLGLYASREYLAGCAPIRSARDVADHPIVWYIEERVDFPELRSLAKFISPARIAFRSSSILAQQQAVAAGLGLGLLHHFAARENPSLVPVLTNEVSVEREYWLLRAADNVTAPRVRAVSTFIQEIVTRHQASFSKPPDEP